MKIKLREITIRELAEGYNDDGEGGVTGYDGKLDIRPPYQREFIYKDQQRNAVINTIRQGFPLNVMYWSDRGDGTFEIIDGQQRTISACQYVQGSFSIDGLAFHNLQEDEKEHVLNYRLMVYVCSGTDSEKLKWFETINIAGVVLTKQELLNAIYHGPWVSNAKSYFSRPGCPAYEIANKHLNGSPIRQDYLETAIRWINDGRVKEYMSDHQHDKNAVELWNHFRSVIDWVKATFTRHRKEMKGVEWGPLYNRFNDKALDPVALEADTKRLILDDDVTSKAGIYPYLLTGEEKYLNIRAFSDAMKQSAFERQKGICNVCKKAFEMSDMEADHITPWADSGKTNAENCQLLCRECNRRKSSR